MKKFSKFALFPLCAIFFACATSTAAKEVSADEIAQKEACRAAFLEYKEAANGFASEISIETYKSDKKELEKMVVNLNDIVKKADFGTWQALLSQDSRNYWSNPRNLRRVSLLYRSQGIVLRSLEDYFRSLVVRSRIDRQMGKIAYVSKDYIKVFEANKDKNVIFYEFVREGEGDWKIKLREM